MCKKKELSVFIVAEEEDNDGEFEEALDNPVEVDNPRTMKLEGRIKGNKEIVMIDPRATHNFISPEIIQKFGIPVDSTEEFGVTLGTGETRMGSGRCSDVEIDFGSNSNF